MKTLSNSSFLLQKFCSPKDLLLYVRSVVVFMGLYLSYIVDSELVLSFAKVFALSSLGVGFVVAMVIKGWILLTGGLMFFNAKVRLALRGSMILAVLIGVLFAFSLIGTGLFEMGLRLFGVYVMNYLILLSYVLLCFLGLKISKTINY